MIEEVLMSAWYGYYGGGIQEMIYTWQREGIFAYLLPFILLFAVIFGLLSKMQFFGKDVKTNNTISAIIALAISLMAIQFEFVPLFFQEIFPKVGVGLSIILILLILVGLFLPKEGWVTYTFMGIGALIVAIILIQTAGVFSWTAGWWWHDNWPMVAGAIFILVLIAVIVGSANKTDQVPESPLLNALFKGKD